MEMHSQRSLYEIHGISTPPRRQSRGSPIARNAINRFLAVLKTMKTAIETEWAARRTVEELAGMNDHMLRDLGIARDEIESTVRRPRARIGTHYARFLSNDIVQDYAALPTTSSSYLLSEVGPSSSSRDSDHGDDDRAGAEASRVLLKERQGRMG